MNEQEKAELIRRIDATLAALQSDLYTLEHLEEADSDISSVIDHVDAAVYDWTQQYPDSACV